jgi:hypothetical protein
MPPAAENDLSVGDQPLGSMAKPGHAVLADTDDGEPFWGGGHPANLAGLGFLAPTNVGERWRAKRDGEGVTRVESFPLTVSVLRTDPPLPRVAGARNLDPEMPRLSRLAILHHTNVGGRWIGPQDGDGGGAL